MYLHHPAYVAAQLDVDYLEKISEAQSGNFSVSCPYLEYVEYTF